MKYEENRNVSNPEQNNSTGRDGQVAGSADRPGADTGNGKAALAPAADAGTKHRDNPEFKVPSFLDMEKAREKNGNMKTTAAQAGSAGKPDAPPAGKKTPPSQAGDGDPVKRVMPETGKMAGKEPPVAPASRGTADRDGKGEKDMGRKDSRQDRKQPDPGSFHVIDLDDKEDPPVLEEAGKPAAPVIPPVPPAAGKGNRTNADRQGNNAGDSTAETGRPGKKISPESDATAPSRTDGKMGDRKQEFRMQMDGIQWEILQAIAAGISFSRDVENAVMRRIPSATRKDILMSAGRLAVYRAIESEKVMTTAGNYFVFRLTDFGKQICMQKPGNTGTVAPDAAAAAAPVPPVSLSGWKEKKDGGKTDEAYDPGTAGYVKFMDDVQWGIIRAIGAEGISVYREVETRLLQGHREFTKTRIRTSLKLLEGHGIVVTEKAADTPGGCTICRLTDAGGKIFRWKYGKDPVMPEAGGKTGDEALRPVNPLEEPAPQEELPVVKRSYGSVHTQEETSPEDPGAEKISIIIRDRSATKDIIGRKGRFSPWDFITFRTGDDSEPVCGYLISTKRGEIEIGTLDSGVRKYSTKHIHGMHHIAVVAEYPAGDQILRVTAHNKAGLYGFIGELILADADKGAVKDFAERFGIAEDLAEFL